MLRFRDGNELDDFSDPKKSFAIGFLKLRKDGMKIKRYRT
jgi:hypothetical protein